MNWMLFDGILSIPERKPVQLVNCIRYSNEKQKNFLVRMDRTYSNFLNSIRVKDYQNAYSELLNYYSLLMGIILKSSEMKINYQQPTKIFLAEWTTISGKEYSYTTLQFERCMIIVSMGVVLSRIAEEYQRKGQEKAKKKYAKCVSLFEYLKEVIVAELKLDQEIPFECTKTGATALSNFFISKHSCVISQQVELRLEGMINEGKKESLERYLQFFQKIYSRILENIYVLQTELSETQKVNPSLTAITNAIIFFGRCVWVYLQFINLKAQDVLFSRVNYGKTGATLRELLSILGNTDALFPDGCVEKFQMVFQHLSERIRHEVEDNDVRLNANAQYLSESTYEPFRIIKGTGSISESETPRWLPCAPIYFPDELLKMK